MNALTREWVAKAEEDYSVASGLLRRRKIPANSICFHCQQAGEKFLKGVLQEHGVRSSRTHDLEELLRLAQEVAPELSLLSDDCRLLSDYAVKYRYPGLNATVRQARAAVKAAKHVRSLVKMALGTS